MAGIKITGLGMPLHMKALVLQMAPGKTLELWSLLLTSCSRGTAYFCVKFLLAQLLRLSQWHWLRLFLVSPGRGIHRTQDSRSLGFSAPSKGQCWGPSGNSRGLTLSSSGHCGSCMLTVSG